MNLVDTSAWVDFLRGVQSPATSAVRDLLDHDPASVVICEPVAMELLAGAGNELQWARLEQLVNGLPTLSFDPVADFRAAATIFRAGRRAGFTVRSLVDCLIAAVAVRHDALLFHKDADYDVIARIVPLRVTSLR